MRLISHARDDQQALFWNNLNKKIEYETFSLLTSNGTCENKQKLDNKHEKFENIRHSPGANFKVFECYPANKTSNTLSLLN